MVGGGGGKVGRQSTTSGPGSTAEELVAEGVPEPEARSLPEFDSGVGLARTLFILLALALVLQVALPHLRNLRVQGQAEDVAEAVGAIAEAASAQRDAQGGWPPSAPPGQIPSGMMGHLPAGFSFEGDGYRLGWGRWTLPEGLPSGSGAQEGGMVVVAADRPELGEAVARRLPDLPHYRLGSNYTFLIEGP